MLEAPILEAPMLENTMPEVPVVMALEVPGLEAPGLEVAAVARLVGPDLRSDEAAVEMPGAMIGPAHETVAVAGVMGHDEALVPAEVRPMVLAVELVLVMAEEAVMSLAEMKLELDAREMQRTLPTELVTAGHRGAGQHRHYGQRRRQCRLAHDRVSLLLLLRDH